MINPQGILMIEPKMPVSEAPLIDELTRKMTAAWHKRRDSDRAYRGFHICHCNAWSDNRDHYVMVDGRELLTNSLCIHYLAFHRLDISAEELEKVRTLQYGEEVPTEDELVASAWKVQ